MNTRKKVDLKTLPVFLQYVIALLVSTIVFALAWYVGKDKPIPDWIQNYIMPNLGWIGIVLLSYFFGRWLINKVSGDPP
ncbi:hypothetical protein BV372_20360 [Nostoc sp. T09]|uniref:hypothetical protein n=1 Tax=Nostoc sp. T09 TaxID=1932621 RepID=UPI000B72359D|nr:hypothetical protein [Nostoc sp. T09]OUL31317.1 hypothetical protein BV372_20360 [Nostoc sp. T09]